MRNSGETVRILVNGRSREVPQGETVLSLLETLEIPPDRVAVELDRVLVRRETWADARLRDGSEVEIVHFVGGG
jgi:thiamine biosynthesis protein ThiS